MFATFDSHRACQLEKMLYIDSKATQSDSKMSLPQVSPSMLDASSSVAPIRPSITDEEAAALARTIVNLFRRWQLDDAEACAILGGMPNDAWTRWKEGKVDHPERINNGLRRRMAILMGVHVGLSTLFDTPERCCAWVRNPNEDLKGKAPLDFMMQGKIDNLIRVRDWLYAACQLW